MKTHGFNHTICEVCWFARCRAAGQPPRLPIQLARDARDIAIDFCCLCYSMKVTRIWVWIDPETEVLLCEAEAHEA